MYWYRRISSEETALDVEDLALVADALGIDLSELYLGMARSPRPRVSEDRGSGKKRARRDSNPQPSGWEPALGDIALADVVELASWPRRSAPGGWESESLAPVLDLTARVDERAS